MKFLLSVIAITFIFSCSPLLVVQNSITNKTLIESKTWFVNIWTMNEFLELKTFTLSANHGHSYFEFKPNNTFIFWTDFEDEKRSDDDPDDYIYETTISPYEGKFAITNKNIELQFNNGNKNVYDYVIINQSDLLLKIRK